MNIDIDIKKTVRNCNYEKNDCELFSALKHFKKMESENKVVSRGYRVARPNEFRRIIYNVENEKL